MSEIKYQYHHIGIPTDKPRPGERYSSRFKMYTSDGGDIGFRIQWHRFEEDSPLHPLLKTIAHVAFKVKSIDEAIKGRRLLLEPYYPFEGFRVAVIEDNGAPVEFIETDLSEEDIWSGNYGRSFIYPDNNM